MAIVAKHNQAVSILMLQPVEVIGRMMNLKVQFTITQGASFPILAVCGDVFPIWCLQEDLVVHIGYVACNYLLVVEIYTSEDIV